MSMTGAQALLTGMEAAGIQQVFGYPGGCIMPVYDALLNSTIRHYLCRHEQGCALAADGFARSSGSLGVAIATSGPGATNLLTGVANAAMDSVPLLVITGQVPSGLIGTDAFQEVDVLGLTFGITKHSYLVTDAAQIPRVITEAIALAQSGRPGPVWIDISKDALLATIDATEQKHCKEVNFEQDQPQQPDNKPLTDDLTQIITMIRNAERPLIYSGGGISKGNALEEYREFQTLTGIPSVETLNGLGNAGLNQPNNLGLVGMHGSKAANYAVEACDLLIAMGARFDDRATGELSSFAPKARIIQFDIDRSENNKLKRADIFLHGDLKLTLKDLNQSWKNQSKDRNFTPVPWQEYCAELKRNFGFKAIPSKTSIHGPDVLQRLDQASEGAIVSCDVGQHQMWVAQYLQFAEPRNHLSSGGLGTMGYGLPAAIGAQIRFPNKRVISVCGDGSFMMNIQELATLNRYSLPVKVIVLDNAHLGLVRQQQELFYQQRFSESNLEDNPCFSEIARAFGLEARTISESDSIDASLNWLLNSEGPALLHIHIDREAGVWPMVPPGAANSEMLEDNNHV